MKEEATQRKKDEPIQDSTLLQAGDAIFGKKRRFVILCIIIFSVVLRLCYFAQLNQGPLTHMHEWDQTDMHFFHTWAVDILKDDLLTDKPLHPYNRWNRDIANSYFSQYPGSAMALVNSRSYTDSGDELGKLLWNRWFGGKQFHQEPLYAYLIATTYKIFGIDVRWVFSLQMIAGVFVNILIYMVARSYFGDTVAVVSALLAILCGPLLYYDMILVRSTFVVFMQLALIALFGVALKQKNLLLWLLLGLLSGVGVLLKTTFILFVLGFSGILLVSYRGKQIEAVKRIGALCLGLLLSLSPAIARNVIVGVPPLSLSSVGAIVFISTNDSLYSADQGPIIPVKTAAYIMGKTEGKLLPTVIETMKTYGNLAGYLGQVWKKISMIFNWYEVPNNTNYYLYRQYGPVLLFTFITFFILSPLSIMGIAIALYRRLNCWPLYMFIVIQIILLLGFGVTSRYRMPLLVLLIPFAALTIVQFAADLMAKAKRALILAALVILISFWTSQTRFNSISPIRATDFAAVYLYYYKNLVDSSIEKKDFATAAEIMKGFLANQPSGIEKINRAHPASSVADSKLAVLFSDFHRTYAMLLYNSGNKVLSRVHEMRSDELAEAASLQHSPQ